MIEKSILLKCMYHVCLIQFYFSQVFFQLQLQLNNFLQLFPFLQHRIIIGLSIFLISHSNMCLFFLVDWIESGMESDVAPDEMYLMLQADMVSRYLDVYIFIPVESCLKMN